MVLGCEDPGVGLSWAAVGGPVFCKHVAGEQLWPTVMFSFFWRWQFLSHHFFRWRSFEAKSSRSEAQCTCLEASQLVVLGFYMQRGCGESLTNSCCRSLRLTSLKRPVPWLPPLACNMMRHGERRSTVAEDIVGINLAIRATFRETAKHPRVFSK